MTVGNTLGSVVNWIPGIFFLCWSNWKGFPFSQRQLDPGSDWFRRYGEWSLLPAWTLLIGDPLTFVADASRVRFVPILRLVKIRSSPATPSKPG